jgi:hypothetical protein
MLFDGVDEYVDIPNHDVNQDFAVSVWIKTTSNNEIVYSHKCWTSTSNKSGWFISTTSGGKFKVNWAINFNTWYGSAYSSIESTTSVNDGNWHHAVVTKNGTAIKMYIDDSLEVNITASDGTIRYGTSAVITTIGNAGNWALHFTGCIDELALFDYTLTDGNVSTIYNGGSGYDLDLLSTAPVDWFRMGDGDDTISVIYNVGSNNYDGTPTNMESGDIQTDVP